MNEIDFKPQAAQQPDKETNKRGNVSVIRLGAAQGLPVTPKVTVNKSAGWVNFGANNLFPQELINIIGKSPVNTAIIRSVVTYICAGGVRDKSHPDGAYAGTPNVNDKWDGLIERIATDYKTFGGFYLQVIVNMDGATVSVFHQDYSAVRVGRIDEKGNPLSYRIASDWTKTGGKYKPLELNVWPGSMAEANKGEAYLFAYRGYSPGLFLYSLPDYYAGIEYIKADSALGEFYNDSIENGFTPSVVFSFPSNPGDEKKAQIQRDLEEGFTGPRGRKVVCLWGENSDVKPQITPFTAGASVDMYNNMESIVFQKIISAHRLSSPTLAGVSGGGNLSGNAAEIIDAYILYNYTVVEKMRRDILDNLNIFTRINGLHPLTIDDTDVVGRIRDSRGGEKILTIQDGNSAQRDGLAARLGSAGIQILIEVMGGPLPPEQKRGLLSELFGLTDTQLDRIFKTEN